MNSVETSKLGQLRRAAVTRQVSALREATILAMSNMLTANIDSGLTHAISKWTTGSCVVLLRQVVEAGG